MKNGFQRISEPSIFFFLSDAERPRSYSPVPDPSHCSNSPGTGCDHCPKLGVSRSWSDDIYDFVVLCGKQDILSVHFFLESRLETLSRSCPSHTGTKQENFNFLIEQKHSPIKVIERTHLASNECFACEIDANVLCCSFSRR